MTPRDTAALRPFGGLPKEPFDHTTFEPRTRGMNGQAFTHVVVSDWGTPGRRQALHFSTSEDAARRSIARLPPAYFNDDATLWIEPLPAPYHHDQRRPNDRMLCHCGALTRTEQDHRQCFEHRFQSQPYQLSFGGPTLQKCAYCPVERRAR